MAVTKLEARQIGSGAKNRPPQKAGQGGIVMAKVVTGELYEKLDAKLFEIKRQIRQKGGYPYDPEALDKALQEIIEGEFAKMRSEESSAHLINCDTAPFIPSGWKVLPEDQLPNRVTGSLKWNKDQVKFYLSEPQRQGKLINGYDLKEKLMDKEVLPANVLDYLLANPHLIPEAWKGMSVFFWGTIYRGASGGLRVRCLHWCGNMWSWSARWLDFNWGGGDPVALLRA